MGAPSRALQNLLLFQRQMVQIQNILNVNPNLFLIHSSLNIEPLTPNTPYLPHSFTKLSNVCNVGSDTWREGHKCSFSFRSRGTMCEDSTSFDFLSVHSLAYLPYYIPIIGLHEFPSK
jgi:hypothetical protein